MESKTSFDLMQALTEEKRRSDMFWQAVQERARDNAALADALTACGRALAEQERDRQNAEQARANARGEAWQALARDLKAQADAQP